jgi:hypothetical protein
MTRFIFGAFKYLLQSYWPCGFACSWEACEYLLNQASFKGNFMSFRLQNAKQAQAWGWRENVFSWREHLYNVLLLEERNG